MYIGCGIPRGVHRCGIPRVCLTVVYTRVYTQGVSNSGVYPGWWERGIPRVVRREVYPGVKKGRNSAHSPPSLFGRLELLRIVLSLLSSPVSLLDITLPLPLSRFTVGQ